tara:strand:- start:12845 stop:13930 length:1086 start_codon:yes stop_codon:yes gene_type:complete
MGNLDGSNAYGGGTDSLFRMSGRGTGHFGSGTYFSTYRQENPEVAKYLDDVRTDTPITQLKSGVYVADLERFGLYRVKSTEQADLLFNTLRKINDFFYGYANTGKLDAGLKSYLLDIKKMVNRLGLTVPDKFIRLANKYVQFYKEPYNKPKEAQANPTLATLFMEMNGFNGVNVNGIARYDNTMHGSVIYNLDKVTSTPKDAPNIGSEFDFNNVEMATMVDKINRYGISVLDLSSLSNENLNLLLKASDKIIDLHSLEYMVQEDKLTQDQNNHILKVYPNIIKPKLSSINPKDIPEDTFAFLLKRNVLPYDINELVMVIYNKFYRFNRNDEQFILSYVNGIKDKVTNPDAIEVVGEILSYL